MYVKISKALFHIFVFVIDSYLYVTDWNDSFHVFVLVIVLCFCVKDNYTLCRVVDSCVFVTEMISSMSLCL